MNPAHRTPVLVAIASCLVVVSSAAGGFGIGPPKPSSVAMTADVVVVGKITEMEADPVEAVPHGYRPPAPKSEFDKPKLPKASYKIVILKIEDPLIGARGLTQLRVGVPDVIPGPRGGRPPIVPAVGQEGCYFLTRHSTADFYVHLSGFGVAPLLKNPGFEKDLGEIKTVAKAIEDPVGALQSKKVEDRFIAAQTILSRYGRIAPKQDARGEAVTEDIPAEENKLILDLLLELPWMQEGGPPVSPANAKPSRSALWFYVHADKLGFKAPPVGARKPKAGQPPPNVNKEWDEATTAFLKENRDKIKLQKPVPAK
jgi:hypothetical protein